MESEDSCHIPISPWSSSYINNLVRDESCPLNGPFSHSRACEFPIPANNLFQIKEAGDQTELPGSHVADAIKAQIANHPRYHDLVSASIECQKVGAAPEMASYLEEICEENYQNSGCSEIGANPELDEFMESYCKFLRRCKDEISKTFGEATMFLTSMESQLIDLCKLTSTRITIDHGSDEAAGASEEELSCGEVEAPEETNYQESDVKGMLIRKYRGYISNLRREILKKRKKTKLPKDARTTLLEWWNGHCVWPYPTEEDKVKLSEMTGLHQKQVNNWFINQRKRHWKPPRDITRFAHNMEGVSGSMHGPRADPRHDFGTE